MSHTHAAGGVRVEQPGASNLDVSTSSILIDPSVTEPQLNDLTLNRLNCNNDHFARQGLHERVLSELSTLLAPLASADQLDDWLNTPCLSGDEGSVSSMLIFLQLLSSFNLQAAVATFQREATLKATAAGVPSKYLPPPARLLLAAASHLSSSLCTDVSCIRGPGASGHLNMAGLSSACAPPAVRELRLFTLAQAVLLQSLPAEGCSPWKLQLAVDGMLDKPLVSAAAAMGLASAAGEAASASVSGNGCDSCDVIHLMLLYPITAHGDPLAEDRSQKQAEPRSSSGSAQERAEQRRWQRQQQQR